MPNESFLNLFLFILPWGLINIALVVLSLFLILKFLRYRYLTNRLNRIYEDKKSDYEDIINRHNPYFRSLDPENKDRFIKRTIFFKEAKEFNYVGMEEEEQVPVLISATAIQLTFGLEHYLLDYFSSIYILKDDYRYKDSMPAFEGNVSENGIYFSWKSFIREYDNYADGENVGLHEMAHALTYVNFRVQDGMDHSFRKKFYAFSPIARPVFNRMQKGESVPLLDKYAATNYEEFWAVCVETFFEEAVAFKEQMPELYLSLCELLNQDPSTKGKVLKPLIRG